VTWEPTAARIFDFEAGAGGKLLPVVLKTDGNYTESSPDPPVFPHFIRDGNGKDCPVARTEKLQIGTLRC